MKEQKIAGTVILHDLVEQTLFLIAEDQKSDLIITHAEEEKTALSSILATLKSEVGLDVTKLNLVELTNAVHKGESIPLFVFEVVEQDYKLIKIDEQKYKWERPNVLRAVLADWDISGVPQFG